MTATEAQPLPHVPAYRCSPWTRAQGVDPVGSAPSFDALVLVEWPLPWPHDVADIPELASASATPGVRVMTVVPRHDDGGDGLTRVVHHRRVGVNRLVGVDHRVPRAEVPALLEVLAADPLGDHSSRSSAVGAAPPEVLICGHGRRDACCGRWGTLLHVELVARPLGDTRIWRCSHTGGHRFAPTAITLPDGRAWAYADVDLLEGVVRRAVPTAHLAAHDRGTSGLDPWAQVVERAMFERTGWAWLDREADASVELDDAGRAATVRLRWRDPDGSSGSVEGRVEVARTLPVLVCGEPPEHATKTSPEYALRHLEVT
jgi:hypothetical protein